MEILVGRVRIHIYPGAFGVPLGAGLAGDLDVSSISIFSGEGGKALHPPRSLAANWNRLRPPRPTSRALVRDFPATLAGTKLPENKWGAACSPPDRIADASEPTKISPFESLGGRAVAYGGGDDIIVDKGSTSGLFQAVAGGAGNDRFHVYDAASGSRLYGGAGADRIEVCSVAPGNTHLELATGDGEGSQDADPDTVVLQPAVFDPVPAGFEREVEISDFVSINDRLVLRLPPAERIVFGLDGTGTPSVTVGSTVVTIVQPAGLGRPFNWNSVIIVPTTATPTAGPPDSSERAPASPKEWAWGSAKTLSGQSLKIDAPQPSCATMRSPAGSLKLAKASEGVSRTVLASFPYLYYTHADDLIRLEGKGKEIWARAGRGDDAIYMFEIGDNSTIDAGSGADKLVLCSMHGVMLTLFLGPNSVDRQPDTVVLEPAVFLDVPAGFVREISVSGFLSTDDRLLLHLPPGIHASAKRMVGGSAYVITAGRVRITVGTGVAGLEIPFDRNAIAIVDGAARMNAADSHQGGQGGEPLHSSHE